MQAQIRAAGLGEWLVFAHAKRLGSQRIDTFDEAQSTDGWNLATRGYVPPEQRCEPAQQPRQESLPL